MACEEEKTLFEDELLGAVANTSSSSKQLLFAEALLWLWLEL